MDPAVLLDMLTAQLSSILYSSAISRFSHMTQQNHINVSPWYQSSHSPNLLYLFSSLINQQTTELHSEHLIYAACTWIPSIAHMLKRSIEQGFGQLFMDHAHDFAYPQIWWTPPSFQPGTIKLIILVTCSPVIGNCAWGRPSRYKEMECQAHQQERFRSTFSLWTTALILWDARLIIAALWTST